MRSSNPVFSKIQREEAYVGANTASYRGISLKTMLLLGLAVLSGVFLISSLYRQSSTGSMDVSSLSGLLFGSMAVAFISVLVASFVPRLAMPFSILYAVSEGVALGFLTLILEIIVPGIAITAIIATATIFVVMLFLYSSRAIRVTHRFRKIMYGALFSILILSVVFGLLYFIAPGVVALVSQNTGLALIVSGALIIFGALMLTLDFDRAETIVESGADKMYEWVVALGLMVTIVWIYVELLRFLLIIASRRN
ncbi:MAG: Bax inhibitor-1/YccA family protein [Acholeplasmataceae bacterium]|nr:Bax inhibitor-1/YccA family protein [Acholeplasmataceae bacterium]